MNKNVDMTVTLLNSLHTLQSLRAGDLLEI